MPIDNIPTAALRALAERGYKTPARSSATCDCPAACPTCGGLECLCRPRFFAGQVLTEDDLNRLENYVLAKNKLYNRHFHGPGVVCGLEAVCDACDSGSVVVKPGYAISPCGDDIIVCNETKVNVCDLIQRCRPPDDNCDPYGSQAPTECQQGVQKWVLSICYEEKPSRGVQPLMTEPCACKASGGSCGCGGGSSGSSGGGCGCGGGGKSRSSKTATSTSRAASKYNPQCEPTLICESFSFTATKYVPPTRRPSLSNYGAWGVVADKAEQFGPLLSQLMACYLRAVEIRDAFSQLNYAANANDLATHYAEYVDLLRQFAEEHLSHRCDLQKQLYQLDMPRTPNLYARIAAPSAAEWAASFEKLNTLWLDIFRDCFCSALLPPCPAPQTGNCVPLAVVTIDMNTCRVVEICNWQAREFSLTLPSLYYWTSFINWGAIKDVIAKLCCEASSEQWMLIFRMFETMLANNTKQPLPPTNVVVTAARATPAPNATQPSPFDASVPAATFDALMKMLTETTRPDGMARVLSVVQPTAARASTEVAGMRDEIATLKRQVDELRTLIEQLRKR